MSYYNPEGQKLARTPEWAKARDLAYKLRGMNKDSMKAYFNASLEDKNNPLTKDDLNNLRIFVNQHDPNTEYKYINIQDALTEFIKGGRRRRKSKRRKSKRRKTKRRYN